jgi:PAS domain S-box-containing protein
LGTAVSKSAYWIACGHVADNTFVAVNEAFARDRGYSGDELVGKPILSVYAPEVLREMKARFQEVDRLGHLVYESVHQRKDGTRFPVLMEVAVIKDEKGSLVSRVAYALDITERKRAERAIHENEERFRLVAEVTNDVLWDWDLITDDHWWSPNARENCGYDPVKEPCIGAWRSRLYLDDRNRVLRHLDECLRSGERTYLDEYRLLLSNGSYGIF